ncbi:MAG: T9SS type A sorting domain-containing protein [Candidatus Cloacimonetes bacterium]|nr:T9SS type A sorting domain-containing protein [Candidatus Cloacimonadota bacterium]MCF7813624.1 T9SS type A sorting domain-containing protein [Candidatus Cloacimonadota bacterium]MCF7868303.1 T9SS type A sorting domain-containing protein [Candidatus Cloacimonadota bacterium]MCF7883778.1 T9SS type A sorting domain-containing protein [Candidatus Cloacimonadota bacterium]
MRKLFFIFFILLVSNLILGQEFGIATNPWSQTYPEASFANGQYFTVYLDKRSSSYEYEFWARFVSPDGTVDPIEHQILPPYNAMSFMHHLAWGSSNYLFAWSRQRSPYNYTRDAYGIFVDQDGNPSGGQFAVSSGNTESCSFLKVAFDGTNYLVVWQEGMPNQGANIRGQFVAPNGSMIGSNFDIRPAGLATTVSQIYPDVLFNGTNYVVAWDDDRNGNRDIFMQFVGTDGTLIGDDIAVCTNATKQLLVQFAYNGNNYLLVWSDERDSTNDDSIYGQLVGTDGSLIGDNIPISITQNSEGRSWPAIAASAGQYLVTWKQDFLVYDDDTKEIAPEQEVMNLSAGLDPSDPTLWYDVWGRKVEFDGTIPEPEFAICTVDNHQDESCVASDGTDFLVAWEDSRNANQYYDIYGLIVEGVAVDPGFVEGIVTLSGGTGNVEDVMISTGTTTTNPDASGFYQLELLPGNYILTAEMDYFGFYETDIQITSGSTVTQNMTLEYLEPPYVVLNPFLWIVFWEPPQACNATLIGYNVYLDGVLVAIVDPDVYQYEYAGLVPGQLYVAGVSAVYEEGESYIVEDYYMGTYIQNPPSNASYEIFPDHIHLTWQPPEPGSTYPFDFYRIYLDGELIEETTDFSYDIYDLINGQNYLIGITAVYQYLFESDPIQFSISFVGTDKELIPSTKLIGNYPNPFNPSTTISFSVTQSSDFATIEIYSLKGQKVKIFTFPNGSSGTSEQSVVWNGNDNSGKPVSSGIYFYRLQSGDYAETRKMILMK